MSAATELAMPSLPFETAAGRDKLDGPDAGNTTVDDLGGGRLSGISAGDQRRRNGREASVLWLFIAVRMLVDGGDSCTGSPKTATARRLA